MAVQDYKINYKSDFVLNINGDAGWAVPFCIKFWTGMPSQAYFVGFDGVKYVNCRVGDTPTQLLVMFDDHHLPIGKLMMQIAYHTTIEEFPGSVFDEVTNARDVIVTIDGTDYQVLLDFTGEDAPELEFNLPAYANEAERIQNELQRQQNEAARIAAELQREQATAAAVQGAENVNAQLNGTTLTVTNRQGVSTSVNTKGEQGEQGPVGPEGPQGEQGPKGEKGDTGATGSQGIQGPAGPQGQTGVSITDFVKTGETETDTLYDIEFSDDTTKPVSIPKGEKGDQGEQGPQGPQGPMGDVAVITPEQQAAFTMYSVPGQNTDGPMTQKAVTDALGNIAASGVSYDNSQSGLSASKVQDAIDDITEGNYSIAISSLSIGNGYLHLASRKWVVDSKNRKHYILPRIPSCNKITITASSSVNAYIAFLRDYETPVNGATPSFCGCPLNIVTIPLGETAIFDIPSDCKFIIIYARNVNTITTPAAVSLLASSKCNNEGIYDIDFDYIYTAAGWVGSDGEVVTGTGRTHYRLPVSGIEKIDISAGEGGVYFTWATELSTSGWTRLVNARYTVASNATKTFQVPDGANYIIIGKSAGSTDVTPVSVIMYTQTGSEMNALSNIYQGVSTPVDFSQYEALLGWLGSSGEFVRNNIGASHYSIPVVGNSVTIEANDNNTNYLFASAVEGYTWTVLTGETRNIINSGTVTVPIPDGAKYILFGIMSSTASETDHTPKSVVFHEELPDWINRMNSRNSTTLWRFMTYNIGHLNGGGVTAIDKRRKSSITDSDYDSKKEAGLAICNQFRTDFIGVEEYPLDFAPFSASHSTETTREILFKKYWSSYIDLNSQDPAHIGDENYDGYNAMFGRIPLLDLHKVEWNSELLADKFYMVGAGLIGECEVKIALAHFRFNNTDLTDSTIQEIQVAELVEAFKQDEYVIIMGDLNLPSLSVLDPFVADGYSLANGGEFGTFPTYRKNDGFANKALDNIIVKGFNIKNVYMIDSNLSDHNPFLADLEVI